MTNAAATTHNLINGTSTKLNYKDGQLFTTLEDRPDAAFQADLWLSESDDAEAKATESIAAEIVRKVIAHDALLAALRDMVCRASPALDFALADVPEGGCVPSVLTELENSLRFARAALAKAVQS
jgi:hypothetical protein